MAQIANVPADATQILVSFAYRYNEAGQRVRTTLADGSFWVYQYDNLGQVISGKHYWVDGTPVAGQQYEYSYDDIGNRLSSKAGGDETGMNLRAASYTPNLLNQYSSRTVSGALDVLGLATPASSLTINGSSADFRKGAFFQEKVTVSNSGTPEAFSCDTDGNLLSDGRWTYTWDAENRLVQMQSLTNAPSGSKRKLEFGYDVLGRRVWKRVTDLDASQVTAYLRFVYDGWNLLAELNATNGAPVRTYVWGNDLSGTMQGAGGVGGLLMVDMGAQGVQFVAGDGNGNLTTLASASTGQPTATYEYGPFGEPIRVTGALANGNPFRFSSKYQDEDSGLLYYGYRYFNTSIGGWINRDPLAEEGGLNVYGFVDNDGLNYLDVDGREKGAEALERLARGKSGTFTGMHLSPLTAVRLLLGLPGDVLSGDIFTRGQETKVENGKCNVLITVNGILNNLKNRQDLNDGVIKAPRYSGAQPMQGINPTSYIGDPIQIIFDEVGTIQTASFRLARQINSVYEQFKKNGCCCAKIQVFAHSQGTMTFRRAWPMLKPEARKLIYYTGIGGETTIQGNYGLAGQENYVNRTDFFNRDWVSIVGNLNPLRIPTWPIVGFPKWNTVTPQKSHWMEHHFKTYYEDFVKTLQVNGPCIPVN